jgi:hypothetical protein
MSLGILPGNPWGLLILGARCKKGLSPLRIKSKSSCLKMLDKITRHAVDAALIALPDPELANARNFLVL